MKLFFVLFFAVTVCAYAEMPRGSHSSYRSHSYSSGSHRSYRPYRSSRSRSYTHRSRSYRSTVHIRTHRSSGSHYRPRYPIGHTRSYASGVQRDRHGRIKRSESAKRRFMRMTGYPHGRPGYVVDHIKPLSEGGADDPSNMQWQTKADAKAKDRWERGGK